MVMLSRLLVIGSDGDIKRGGLFWRHGDFVSWIPSGCNEKGIIVVCNTLAWPVYTILCIHGFMLFWGTPSTTPYSSPTPNSLLVDCCVINYYAVVQGYCPIFLFWKLFHPFLCLCPKKNVSASTPHITPYHILLSLLPTPVSISANYWLSVVVIYLINWWTMAKVEHWFVCLKHVDGFANWLAH